MSAAYVPTHLCSAEGGAYSGGGSTSAQLLPPTPDAQPAGGAAASASNRDSHQPAVQQEEKQQLRLTHESSKPAPGSSPKTGQLQLLDLPPPLDMEEEAQRPAQLPGGNDGDKDALPLPPSLVAPPCLGAQPQRGAGAATDEGAGAAYGTVPAAAAPPAAAPAAADTGQRQHQAGAPSTQTAAAGVLLPRMPVGLRYVSSQGAYQALAVAVRSVGCAAALADAASPLSARPAALRGLADQLLERLRPGARDASETRGGWQQPVASAAVVLAELLFGASPAWHGGSQAAGSAPGGGVAAPMHGVAASNEELEAVCRMALDAITDPALWGLPTSGLALGCPPGLSLQAAGENALLVRALLEAAGATARALGRRFNGRPLRAALLPIAERLGDPCAAVAGAAAAACSAAVAASGAHDLAACVAANSDYIVDGLCRQLRHLDQHPRAPAVLAGLLAVSGVPAALLPLFSEPAAAAFKVRLFCSRGWQGVWGL